MNSFYIYMRGKPYFLICNKPVMINTVFLGLSTGNQVLKSGITRPSHIFPFKNTYCILQYTSPYNLVAALGSFYMLKTFSCK